MDEKTIGGLEVSCDVDLSDLGEGNKDLIRTTLSKVIGDSASLCLNTPKDRRTLNKRLCHALGLDK